MGLKKGDIVELSVSDIAFGGAGIARLEEFVIFVNGVMPGDMVRARLTKMKRNFGEARLETILKPSPQRIAPRCKYFGVCGGCSLQFLDYKEQLKLKEKFVVDALERIGDFALRQAQGDKNVMLSLSKHDILLPIRESPSPWFYRNKMEFTFAHSLRSCVLGLHHTGRFDMVFDLEECYLESQFSVRVISWMRDWAKRTQQSVFDLRGNSGLLKTLIIREARSTGEYMINLVTSDEPFGAREKFTEEITGAFPEITSLYHTAVKIKKGSRTSATETLLAGKPMLTEIISATGNFRDDENSLSLIFDIKPQAFFQTNSCGAEVLLSLLLAIGAPRTDDIVFDLYCGTGIFGMFFAKIVKRVYGIELNPAAMESAKMNASKNGLKNIEFICGDTGQLIKNLPEKPTIVIVDPPRAGLTAKTTEEILAAQPQKILYVSCNPTTLARDLKEFCANGYSLKKVQPVDIFPQTYHVETICLLTKNVV